MESSPSVKQRPYERVADDMSMRIQTGAWRPDQMLPARASLAEEYGVAMATVSRAVSLLAARGLLQIDDRRGTFVAPSDTTSRLASTPDPPRQAARVPIHATVAVLAHILPPATTSSDDSPWSYGVLHAMEDRLGLTPGIVCRLVNIQDTPFETASAAPLAAALADDVDAIVLIESRATDTCIPQVEASGKLALRVGYEPASTSLPQVYIDSAASGTLAARHLMSQGWNHLVFFRPFATPWVMARLQGARLTTDHALGDTPPLAVFPQDDTDLAIPQNYPAQTQEAERQAEALLQAPLSPATGIIGANDAVATGFMQAATRHGLVAGRDFGIVGFDDYGRHLHLSSLRPPLEQLGQEAARGVEALLRGEAPPSRVALRHRLVARDSSRLRIPMGAPSG